MTSYGDTQSNPVTLKSDGLDVGALGAAATPVFGSVHATPFWASARRLMSDPRYEILEVSFGSKRLVNHLSFQLAHFPQTAWLEYLDENGDWQGFTYAKTLTTTSSILTGRKGHRRRKLVTRYLSRALEPVSCVLGDSIPHKVDTGAVTSTQHFGVGHWAGYSMPVTPETTTKIRIRIRRGPHGTPPVNPHGRLVPYSVAVRNLQIGYRVLSTEDIPNPVPDPIVPEQDWWASSRDILGSRTVYSTYRQDAPAVIDGDDSTFWRSEPQPFPFAVVNLFLDLRDANGVAPVVDRFWVDPVTVGPVCNVYYSDFEPVGEFDGVSSPLPDQWHTEIGNPGTTVDRSTGTLVSIDLGPDTQAGFVASNAYERLAYSQPWWVGLDARSLVAADDPNSRPILSMGPTRIVMEDTSLKVVAPTGAAAVIPLDPAVHTVNSHFRMIAAYFAEDEATHRDPYVRLVYRYGDREPEVIEVAIPALADLDSPIKIGLHPDPASTDVSAFGVQGVVVKSESLTPEAEEWFLDEGAEFVADPATPRLDRGTAQNARLRMHPMFRQPTTNPFGVVGGPGDRFDEMEWTPVIRDYSLRRGYLHLPPTRAKYWKFEMTRLSPQVYENFLTIDREVLVFPPDIVDTFNAVAAKNDLTVPPMGASTTASAGDRVAYADALDIVRQTSAPDAASVLVIKDPVLSQQAAKSGWIWTYQPWHIGSSAPQFIGTQVHRYEAIRVRHATKVAFFAGVREITPYRVDYTFDDDTPEYVEHLLDTAFIDTTQTVGVSQTEGSVESTASSGEIVSMGMRSYRTVRGVQFATQETDAVQVLEDSDFLADDLSRWTKYGDASLDLLSPGDVEVNRGWFPNTWGMVEATHPTWGDLDGNLYGALEGNDPVSGYAEGGIVSQTYTPTPEGKVTALVKMSSPVGLSGPVIVEILSAADNRVLASTQQIVISGQVLTTKVSYSNPTLTQTSGGTVHTRTWGDLENSLGVTSIPANGAAVITAPGGSVGATPFDDADDTTYATSTSTSSGTVLTDISTVLPASPTVPSRLTSVKVKVRSSVDDPTGVRGMLSLKDTGSGTVIASAPFDLSDAPVDNTVTLLAPATATGPDSLGAAVQAGATLVLVLDPADGGSMPTTDRTMTVYELGVTAAATSTWGDLDNYRWADLEGYSDVTTATYLNPDLKVRVRQSGPSRDVFHIHRIALYESPISWYFSNDDGLTWWQAVDVRNDPYAVLMFPAQPSPTPGPDAGKVLRWKAKFLRAGVTLNALHIRPWYGTRSQTVDGAHTMEALGPNRSIYDNMPDTDAHPMWTPTFNPIEKAFVAPVELPPFWRNLVPTPSGESVDSSFDTGGGAVTTQADWTYEEVPAWP